MLYTIYSPTEWFFTKKYLLKIHVKIKKSNKSSEWLTYTKKYKNTLYRNSLDNIILY
jgi:hypothetical protein